MVDPDEASGKLATQQRFDFNRFGQTTVKTVIPVGGLVWLGYVVLDVIDRADAEKVAEMSKLLSQVGTIPIVALFTIGCVVYLSIRVIDAKDRHIQDLKSKG